MKTHKLRDALLGKDKRMTVSGDRQCIARAIAFIDRAQIFDFGDVELERSITPDGGVRAHVPQLNQDELQWLYQGLIPLPYQECVFEVRSNGMQWFMLVTATDCHLAIENTAILPVQTETDLLDFSRPLRAIAPGAIGAQWAVVQPIKVVGDSVDMVGIWAAARPESGQEKIEYARVMLICEDEKATRLLDRQYDRHTKESFQEWMALEYGGPFAFMQYLLLMLTSRSTDITREIPPPKLVHAQLKAGKTPLRPHTKVVITPERFRPKADARGGHHASPRMHWRRSHIRVYDRGLATERVKLIARMLVGARESADIIPHDYVVKPAKRA